LVALQAAAIGLLAVALWGLGVAAWGAWLPALGVLAGAWAHGLGYGRRLERSRVKALSVRAGFAAGLVASVAFSGLVLAFPGQVDVPLRALPAVAVVVGVALGIASTALTLCGLDLAGSRFAANDLDIPPTPFR
jgi:hypothetical protein